MANNTIDYRVRFSVESKEYQQTLRKANQATKDFKKQQKEAFQNAGKSAQDGFGQIVAAAKKLAPAVSAAAVALDVAKKALKENQSYTDEWARITESATASYESFVNALSHGDFSGFFANMDDIISAARDAADAIDNLDTTKIFSSRAMSDLDLAAARYRLTLRDKMATADEKEAARLGLLDTRQKQMGVARDQQNANMEAFAATLADFLTRKGLTTSMSDLIEKRDDGTYGIRQGSVFEKYFKDLSTYRSMDAMYKRFKDDNRSIINWQRTGYVTDSATGVTIGRSEYEALRAALELSDKKLKEAFDYYIAGINAEISIINQMASDSRYTASVLGASSTQPTSATTVAEVFSPTRYGAVGSGFQIGNVSLGLPNVGADLIKPSDYKEAATASEIAAGSLTLLTDTIGQLGILSNITAPEVQEFTRTLGSILSIIGSNLGGPWGKALQGIGGIVSSFSGGGVVGGTSYKGDRLLAAVNSGEMILNGYQQKQLLDIISSGGGGGVQNISAVVRGEDMYLALSNYKRRTRR